MAAQIAKERLGRPALVVRGECDTRQQSVASALGEAPHDAELILVHDAVRPLVTREQVERVIAEAGARGAAILGIPAMDTVKESETHQPARGRRADYHDHPAPERVVLAQTPQVFSAALLREAFARAAAEGATASDEAGLVERLHDVYVVLGSERNLKITRPGDIELAEFYLAQERAAR